MRKFLSSLAVTAAALVAPQFAGGIAYAADSATAPAVAPSGCVETFVQNAVVTPGDPIVTIYGNKVVVDAGPTVSYALTQEGNVLVLVVYCLY